LPTLSHHHRCAAVALALSSALPTVASPATTEAAAPAEVLDLDEAAALLRVPADVVRALAEAQRMPARRVGDVWRFSRGALLEWLKGIEPGAEWGASRVPPSDANDERALRGLQALMTARGLAPPPVPAVVAQAVTGAATSPPPTLGERSTAFTAEDVALRDQRVLLKRGALTLEIGATYARSEQTLFPVIRQEQRTMGLNTALRYGLLDDLQATIRVPRLWRRSTTFTDASISGASPRTDVRESYFGDAAISLLGVSLREGSGRPNLIWSIDAVVPTGPGERGIGAGLVLSKSYDPAVVFAGLSYLRGRAADPSDARQSLARHNIGFSLGYTYALNDALALNTVFIGSYRNTRSADGLSIPPPRERYQLQWGMTWMLARGLFVEPAAVLRLGSASPDLAASLNLNYSF